MEDDMEIWERGPPGKLSPKNLWGYAFGAIPVALLGGIFTLKYVEFFYNDLKLLPLYFIIGQIIYMIINALNDPIIGQLTDRTNRERWGSRRIIYVKYGGPIWVFTFLIVWFPWSFDNQFIIFLHYVVSICLFDTLLTLVVMCWMATLPEMTSDTGQRIKANFIAGIIMTIAALPFFIILADMKPTTQTYQVYCFIIAIISTVFLILVSIMTEEKPEFQHDEVFPLWKSMRETMKSKSYLIFIGYNFFLVFNGSIGLSYLFVYVFILGIQSTLDIILFFIILIVIGYLSAFWCILLRPTWGMRKVILRFGTLRIIGAIATFIFIITPGLEWFVWIGIIWGSVFSGYGVYTIGGLMALCMDEDELKYGTRREGMYLGINALFTKPASSLGPIVATIILVYFGYIQGSDTQPASALLGIKILMFLIPTIGIIISLIIISFFPLHGERLKEMQKKLEELHRKKRKQLLN